MLLPRGDAAKNDTASSWKISIARKGVQTNPQGEFGVRILVGACGGVEGLGATDLWVV